MSVKENIKAAMRAKGLNPTSLALQAGMSNSSLHKFFRNEDQSISVRNLEALAHVLEVDIRSFFSSDPEEAEQMLSIALLEDLFGDAIRDVVTIDTKISDLPAALASAVHGPLSERLNLGKK